MAKFQVSLTDWGVIDVEQVDDRTHASYRGRSLVLPLLHYSLTEEQRRFRRYDPNSKMTHSSPPNGLSAFKRDVLSALT